MPTYTKLNPSASSNGAPVKVVATATPGTLFHTAVSVGQDEIYLYLTNTSVNDVLATVEFGGATAPDFHINTTVPANDTVLLVAGVPLTNSVTCKVYAGTANVLNAFGYVNRIV